MDEHIARLQRIYKEKCELMIEDMKTYFHPDVKYMMPDGGMFIWVTLPEHIDMQLFVRKALEKM